MPHRFHPRLLLTHSSMTWGLKSPTEKDQDSISQQHGVLTVSPIGLKSWSLKEVSLSERLSRWCCLTGSSQLNTVNLLIEVCRGPVGRGFAVTLSSGNKGVRKCQNMWRWVIGKWSPHMPVGTPKKWVSLLPLQTCISHYGWKETTFSQVQNWRAAKESVEATFYFMEMT